MSASPLENLETIRQVAPWLKVSTFTKMVDPDETYGVFTNCQLLSQVKWVFLGNQPAFLNVREMNSRFAYCLAKKGDAIYIEDPKGGAKSADEDLDVSRLPQEVSYQGWNVQPEELTALVNKTCRVLKSIGKIGQRMIAICDGQPHQNDSLEKVVQQVPLTASSSRQVKTADLYSYLVKSHQHLFSSLAAAAEKVFSQRQSHLIEVLGQAKGPSNNRFFVVAGIPYFVDEENQIAKTLQSDFIAQKRNYLILYPKTSHYPIASYLFDAKDPAPIPETIDRVTDFFDLPPSCSPLALYVGALLKIKELGSKLPRLPESITLTSPADASCRTLPV